MSISQVGKQRKSISQAQSQQNQLQTLNNQTFTLFAAHKQDQGLAINQNSSRLSNRQPGLSSKNSVRPADVHNQQYRLELNNSQLGLMNGEHQAKHLSNFENIFQKEQGTPHPFISPSLIEIMVHQAFEPSKKDLFNYARREISYSKIHEMPSKFGVGDSSEEQDDLGLRQKKKMISMNQKIDEVLYNSHAIRKTQMKDQKQYYMEEYERIMSVIGERLTHQVQDMVAQMIDNFIAHQQELFKSQESNRGLKKHLKEEDKQALYREIYDSMKKFQVRYEQSKDLIGAMRKNYLKEISHLRAVDDAIFQNKQIQAQKQSLQPSPAKATAAMASSHLQNQQARDPNRDLLEVYYFSPTEGLDQDTCDIFNKYFQKMKRDFESKLNILNEINQELSWKVALIDESKKISEMNSLELIELMFSKEKDQQIIWSQLKKKFSQETFEKIAEDEFAEVINQITEKEIVTQVQKISEESKFQINDAKEKLQKEINYVRLQLSYKTEELEKFKEQKILDMDKARLESYEKAEKRFFENLRIKEEKFQEEREVHQKKLADAMEEDSRKYNSLYLSTAMMKWRFLNAIQKLKAGQGDLNDNIHETLKQVMHTQIVQYLEKIEKLSEIIDELKDQKEVMLIQSDQKSDQITQLEDKIALLHSEIVRSGDTIVVLQRKIEELSQELRGQETALEQSKRQYATMEELVSSLENEKKDLDKKLQISLIQQKQHQEALQLNMKESSDLELILQTISNPAPVMGNFIKSEKFNSKIFAQRTMKNLIDDRQNALQEIYISGMVNASVDTSDLRTLKAAKTQYKEEHFQAQEEILIDKKSVRSIPSINFDDQGVQTDGIGKWVDQFEIDSFEQISKKYYELRDQMMERKRTETIKIPLSGDQINGDSMQNSSMQDLDHFQPKISNKHSDDKVEKQKSKNESKIKHKRFGSSLVSNHKSQKDEDLRNQQMLSEDELEDILLENPDLFQQNLGDLNVTNMNEEVFRKALIYIQNRELRKQNLQNLQKQNDEKLPQVYKRLWEDVSNKSKKSKQLQQHFDKARQLEWIKLLQSNKHLNLKDKNNQEKIKELFQQMQEDYLVRGQTPDQHNAFGNSIQQVNLNDIVDYFSQEQDKQYQEVMKKWKQQQEYKQSQQSTMYLQPVNGYQGQTQQDYSSVYITESGINPNPINLEDGQYIIPNQNLNHFNQPLTDEIGVQTDFYLLESLINRVPQYQVRMNQFMQNKQQSLYSLNSSIVQINQSQLGASTALNTFGYNSLNNSITINNQSQSMINNQLNEQRKKPNLFMNSKIRQASFIKHKKYGTSTNSPKLIQSANSSLSRAKNNQITQNESTVQYGGNSTLNIHGLGSQQNRPTYSRGNLMQQQASSNRILRQSLKMGGNTRYENEALQQDSIFNASQYQSRQNQNIADSSYQLQNLMQPPPILSGIGNHMTFVPVNQHQSANFTIHQNQNQGFNKINRDHQQSAKITQEQQLSQLQHLLVQNQHSSETDQLSYHEDRTENFNSEKYQNQTSFAYSNGNRGLNNLEAQKFNNHHTTFNMNIQGQHSSFQGGDTLTHYNPARHNQTLSNDEQDEGSFEGKPPIQVTVNLANGSSNNTYKSQNQNQNAGLSNQESDKANKESLAGLEMPRVPTVYVNPQQK